MAAASFFEVGLTPVAECGKQEPRACAPQAESGALELTQMQLFAGLIAKLKATKEGGGTLLDHSSVLYGFNMGNASSHDTWNLPIIVAGGGFKHGQYLAYDKENNAPLPNLFVARARQQGLDVQKFASSKGTSLQGFDSVYVCPDFGRTEIRFSSINTWGLNDSHAHSTASPHDPRSSNG